MVEYQRKNRLALAQRKGLDWVERICAACKAAYSVPRKWVKSCYCAECSADMHYIRMDAIAEVNRAIRLGVLMRPDQFRCVDCDSWASVWDHRDYSKPLQVEPVCFSCNARRPPAYRREPRTMTVS